MEKIIETIGRLYNAAPSMDEWRLVNEPSPTLVYATGQSGQFKKLSAIVDIVNFNCEMPKIVNYHNSKSVRLPVSCFKLTNYTREEGFAIIRDNFYDIKVAIISKYGVTMPYNLVHLEISKDELAKEKQEAYDYMSKSPDFNGELFKDDSWIKRWSGKSILYHNNKIYKGQSVNQVYCEGIVRLELPHNLFVPYENEKNMFVCSVNNYIEVANVLNHVVNSNQNEFCKEMNARHERENAK